MDPDVRRQMSGWEERKPPGDVLFAKRKLFLSEQDEWIENGAPGDVVTVERVIEMACSDGVFGEDE